MVDDPAFAQEIEAAELAAEHAAVSTIRSAIDRGDWRSAAWWLERRRGVDWRRPLSPELAGVQANQAALQAVQAQLMAFTSDLPRDLRARFDGKDGAIIRVRMFELLLSGKATSAPQACALALPLDVLQGHLDAETTPTRRQNPPARSHNPSE